MSRPRKSNRHLPKYVTIIHGAYWFRPPKAKAVRVCAVGEESALYRFIADKLDPVTNDQLITLADCLDRYEREIVPQHAPRTQKDYHRYIRRLKDEFGRYRPDELKPKDIGRFLDVPTGRVHRIRMVAVLSAMYSKAVGRWYVADRNPCRDVERDKARKRTRYVTDAEYKTVWDAMPPRIRIAMDLALLTGQRQGDLLTLRWDAVSPEGVLFTPAKTRAKVGKRLLVQISPALEEVLSRAKKLVPQLPREYVLRNRKGKPYSSLGFRAIWQYRMRTIMAKGLLKERFTFHDLRAKSVSDSTDIQKAFERAGHTSMAMTRGVYDRGIRKVDPLR